MSTDQDYLDLLAGQLRDQAETSTTLAVDLTTLDVSPDTPEHVTTSAAWARWIHSGAWVPTRRDPPKHRKKRW